MGSVAKEAADGAACRTDRPGRRSGIAGRVSQCRCIDPLRAECADTQPGTGRALIAGSIREFGWTNPVLVDGENGIIAGHGRVLAARQLGLMLCAVIELSHLNPAQRRAYILADNKLAEQAGGIVTFWLWRPANLPNLASTLACWDLTQREIDALLHSGAGDRVRKKPHLCLPRRSRVRATLVPRIALPALRGQHGGGRREPASRRCPPALADQRSSLRRAVRPRLAKPCRRVRDPAHWQGPE